MYKVSSNFLIWTNEIATKEILIYLWFLAKYVKNQNINKID